jgi:uncharacterized membrane protein
LCSPVDFLSFYHDSPRFATRAARIFPSARAILKKTDAEEKMDHIWYWFAYSFLGYCLEKLFAAATRSSHRLRRCFVFLPLCPVYGFAMVTILLLGAEKLPSAWEQILLGMLAATAMEYAVHWGYERLFQVQFWDYSSTKCDVNGRICLPFSICWGILSMLAVRYVQPVLEGYAALLPEWAAALAVFLVTLDGILTARVLLTAHDIDALTPRTLLRSKRRRTA